jgi:hypothetical protein
MVKRSKFKMQMTLKCERQDIRKKQTDGNATTHPPQQNKIETSHRKKIARQPASALCL